MRMQDIHTQRGQFGIGQITCAAHIARLTVGFGVADIVNNQPGQGLNVNNRLASEA